jgi:hypothetical protein
LDGKSIRLIVGFGVCSLLALTLMMSYSLGQLPDAQTAPIAAGISEDFTRNLVPSPPANVKLTMSRDGKGAKAPRTYELVLRPTEAVAADKRALSKLMFRTAERCALQIGEPPCDVTIRCIAELPDGRRAESSFAKERAATGSLAVIRPIAPAAPRAPVQAVDPVEPAEAAKR